MHQKPDLQQTSFGEVLRGIHDSSPDLEPLVACALDHYSKTTPLTMANLSDPAFTDTLTPYTSGVCAEYTPEGPLRVGILKSCAKNYTQGSPSAGMDCNCFADVLLHQISRAKLVQNDLDAIHAVGPALRACQHPK